VTRGWTIFWITFGFGFALALAACILWTVIFYGRRIMASLADVHAALAVQTEAINELAASMPGPPAATEADLDGVKAGIEANTALIVNMDVPGSPNRHRVENRE